MNDPITKYEKEFLAVKSVIEGEYGKSGWVVRVDRFPEDYDVEGVGIQLSKKNWFNEDGKGIHFETWVTQKEIETRTLKFVMHVLHQDFFPGTDKKPWELTFPFRDDEEVIGYVQSWKGFKMGRAHPIKGQRRFKETTNELIASEFRSFLPLGEKVDVLLEPILN